jgi:hypothetical protein
MKKSMALLPVFFALVIGSIAAKADVVVGSRNPKYGTLIVVGNPNKIVQGDETYSVSINTVGSHSEDNGSIDNNIVNSKLRLRAGQYTVYYSHSHAEIEIRDNETTLMNLQKVTAAPLEKTTTVALLKSREATEDDDSRWETVATWQRTSSAWVAGAKTCSTVISHEGFLGMLPVPRQSCSAGGSYVTVNQSWKSAYFYVLPGTYSMLWTLEDGTTHQEDDIVVK